MCAFVTIGGAGLVDVDEPASGDAEVVSADSPRFEVSDSGSSECCFGDKERSFDLFSSLDSISGDGDGDALAMAYQSNNARASKMRLYGQ